MMQVPALVIYFRDGTTEVVVNSALAILDLAMRQQHICMLRRAGFPPLERLPAGAIVQSGTCLMVPYIYLTCPGNAAELCAAINATSPVPDQVQDASADISRVAAEVVFL